MDLVLVDTPVTLSQSWYVDGLLVDPGVVSTSTTNLAGTVVASGNASGSGVAARTFTLDTTDTADLDTLTTVWTSPSYGVLTSRVEVVGGLLFTETEARAFDGAKLTSTVTYSDALIAGARARITEDFIKILGVAPFPRYKRVTLSGSGHQCLLLPDLFPTSIREAAILESDNTTWTALTADELADIAIEDTGEVYRRSLGIWPWGRRNIRIGYEYGFQQTPGPLKQAALLVLTGGDAQSVVRSDIDYRATSFSDGIGTIRFLTPGLGRGDVWYSAPDVNRILQTFRHAVPGVG